MPVDAPALLGEPPEVACVARVEGRVAARTGRSRRRMSARSPAPARARRAAPADTAPSRPRLGTAALGRLHHRLDQARGEPLRVRIVAHAPRGFGRYGRAVPVDPGSAMGDIGGLAGPVPSPVLDAPTRRVVVRARRGGPRLRPKRAGVGRLPALGHGDPVARGRAGVCPLARGLMRCLGDLRAGPCRRGRRACAGVRIGAGDGPALGVRSGTRGEEHVVVRVRGGTSVLIGGAIGSRADALRLPGAEGVHGAVGQGDALFVGEEEHHLPRSAPIPPLARVAGVDVLDRSRSAGLQSRGPRPRVFRSRPRARSGRASWRLDAHVDFIDGRHVGGIPCRRQAPQQDGERRVQKERQHTPGHHRSAVTEHHG